MAKKVTSKKTAKTAAPKTVKGKAAPKAAAKPIAKASPARKGASAKPAAKTAKPVMKAKTAKPIKPVKAAPAKAVLKKQAPAKKAAPAKAVKAAPKKAAPVKPVSAAKKTAPAPKPVAKKPVAKASAAKTLAARNMAIRKEAPKKQAPAPIAKKVVPPPKPVILPFQPTGFFNSIRVAETAKPFPLKTPYSRDELEKLRQALEEERYRLLGQIASLSGVTMESMSSAKEGSGYSLHIAEHATDLQTAEANLGVRSIEEERLEQVEQALDRIRTNLNHYGLCMACGNKIGIQRLIAQPHALLCLPCRSRYETIRSRRGY